VPTTLLAMVDSSIGGKVGINHARGKNLIGAFHQPRAVVVDPSFLETLPPREVQSGAYEMVKCGVLADRALFRALAGAPEGLLAWERSELEKAIAAACLVKAEVVGRDEREGGLRRVLNLGHTLGHAFEAAGRYRELKHGEAVAWGIAAALEISARRAALAPPAAARIRGVLSALGPFPEPDRDPDALKDFLSRDKKATSRGIAGVVLETIGRARVAEAVSMDEWLEAAGAARLS